MPRSTHLEVLAGEQTAADLLTDIDQGYWFSEASRGRLDPRSGEFVLHLPWGREIRQGELGDLVAPCRLRGRVSDLLGGVTGIGSDRRVAGAGWCAKGGVKLPVWATTSSMRLEGVEVSE